MGVVIDVGYVLEPVRVGQANSPYTMSPDNYISDQGAFDTAYPVDESQPRTDYLVLALSEGSTGRLIDVEFGYTKNEIINRFDYAARAGKFQTLPGSPAAEIGRLSSTSNVDRLKVKPPIQATWVPNAPYRLSVGNLGSGTTWIVTIVANDAAFTAPSAGFAELSLETGNLNWNASDLITFYGQLVRFQQQQFFSFDESTGRVGLPVDLILLTPKPGTGQYPLLRFGYGFYLNTVEVPSEGAFTTPIPGTVQWALDTGRLNFNPTDQITYGTTPVYYDGVVFAKDLTLPRQSLGLIETPSPIVGLPPVGGDLIFYLPNDPNVHQFLSTTYRSSALFTSGKSGVVQVDSSTGAVRFSDKDKADYPGENITVAFGDLPIERGISIRFFRTPINLDGSGTPKDISNLYLAYNSTWADPIIEFPQVVLPSTPIDVSGYPLVVSVEQGQGTYTTADFPRLDVTTPPVGLGYYIDFDTNTFYFAERRDAQLVFMAQPAYGVPLPDPLVLPGNLSLELETGPGTGVYNPLTVGSDCLFDELSGIVSFVEGSSPVYESTASFNSNTLTDTTADFISAGVQVGDLVVVPSTADKGVYLVSSVLSAISIELDSFAPFSLSAAYSIYPPAEVLADRYFNEVSLVDPSTTVKRVRSIGVASNAPRLNIPVNYALSSGFRLGSASAGQMATVVLVPNDGAFGAPSQSTIELSESTGNLNFSVFDLGAEVFWLRSLVRSVDYEMSAELGLIQFTDRLLALEEVLITYITEPPSTDPPTAPDPAHTEYGAFLIRKELTQDHPTPTATLEFNTVGLNVVSDPPPTVFRGGRPQRLGIQCVVDTANSTITFLADDQLTDALPHGAIVAPDERIYIDYYVSQAVGGERTITVSSPPIRTAEVRIDEDDSNGNSNNQFTCYGDHTGDFPITSLLRIENDEVYLIGSSVYDGGTDQTTISLYGTQTFQNSYTSPKLYVSSGRTPIVSAPLNPSFFELELLDYEAVARGSSLIYLPGDVRETYKSGTVLFFSDALTSFTDFMSVSGVVFDSETNRSKIALTSNAIRQYLPGSQWLFRSIRPVYEYPVTKVQTSKLPVLTEPYTVFRKTENEVGSILISPEDYTIDESGQIEMASALTLNEEIAILYTGFNTVVSGINLRASYTCQVTPNALNGLSGQILKADYYLLSPDTFYYRVETLTNFRGEYSEEISDDASGGSSGPQTSNSSQLRLFDQGRPSVYFDERHLANQDIVARATLLVYNNSVNALESYLRYLDGRVVGNNDGLFLFDGTTGVVNPSGKATFPDVYTLEDTTATFSSDLIGHTVKITSGDNKYQQRVITGVPVTTQLTVDPALPYTDGGGYTVLPLNQIDDLIRISKAPYEITYPPFSVTSIGTFVKQYIPGSKSRFYPTMKNFFAVSAVTSDTETGDEVADTGATNVTVISKLHTRLAWALITESTSVTGSGVLLVDDTDGSDEYARPPFQPGMECVVRRRDGTFINDSSSPITVVSLTPNSLVISGLSGTAEAGDTVYRSPVDASSQSDPDTLNNYLFGRDFSFVSDTGQITFIESIPLISNVPLVEEQALSGRAGFVNTLTSPFKFPALYGEITDDDGDLSFPIQTPDPDNEQSGYLVTEDSIIHAPTGYLRIETTAPFTGIGNLDATKTIITDTGGVYPAPAPKIHDLVRVLNGTNGPSDFVRITSVGADNITVDTPFGSVDSGFGYEIAVSSYAISGTASFPNSTTLNDATASFLSTAKIGYTVVITSGTNIGERRQITVVVDNNNLTLDPALPTLGGGTYRIDNSLATYGGSSADYLALLEAALSGEGVAFSTEQSKLEEFFDTVFTDAVPVSITGEINAASLLLDDPLATFLTDGVTPANYVYITSGLNAGIRQVVGVNSETQLEVDSPFPSTESGVSYRVVRLFGASEDTLQILFGLYISSGLLEINTDSFKTLITTPVDVVWLGSPDTDSFARGTLISDLDTRDAIIDARAATGIVNAITAVEDILSNTDRLYDKRYAWISARIDLKTGLVVKQRIAEENRIESQEEAYNQLVKLLAVE